MNEMDLLTRFRDEVPLRVSPHAEYLFRTAIDKDLSNERPVVSPPRKLSRPAWRFAIVTPPSPAQRWPQASGCTARS